MNQSCEYYILTHTHTEWLHAAGSKLYNLPFCPSSLRFNGQISYSYNTVTDLMLQKEDAWMMGTIAFQVPPFCQKLYSPYTPFVQCHPAQNVY